MHRFMLLLPGIVAVPLPGGPHGQSLGANSSVQFVHKADQEQQLPGMNYAIAHGANIWPAVVHAMDSGVNALEMDLTYDKDSGELAFHHGVPCDCTAADVVGKSDDSL